MTDTPLSYRKAGVDIDAGNALIERIRPLVKRTHRPGALGALGGFGGLFELPTGYRQPVLVAATDGVGTKLKLALSARQHRGVGVDLVAMCANDLIVCGAEPLFFLDYYASGRLDVELAAEVIAGISDGCRQAGAALIGGETAEMPGVYHDSDYDLAGFCVGVVEKDRLIDGTTVQANDSLIALASSGPHANGFSLIRKILERSGLALDASAPFLPDRAVTLADVLLAPTRIYVKPLLALMDTVTPRALAHITGGGLIDNLPRVLPEHLSARIDTQSWQRPAVFDWLQDRGSLANDELWRTFNNGIGMVICTAPDDADRALAALTDAGETAWIVGDIVARQNDAQVVLT